jgi:hypothetical protein
MKGSLQAILGMLMALVVIVPDVLLACPSCAGQRADGMARFVILGSMILLPFAIVWVVARGIKRLDAQDADSHNLEN